ncbi:hypothetical protein ACFX11_013365 [Malus domestica]
MEKFFGKEWEALDIHDAIKLSTIEITMDKELLTAALRLWCLATNTMVLSFGPITPTILDILAILGISYWMLIKPRPQRAVRRTGHRDVQPRMSRAFKRGSSEVA